MKDTIGHIISNNEIALDSILLSGQDSAGLPVERISELPALSNFMFIVFIFCFFLISYVIGKKSKMLLSMFDDLIHVKGRQSIFYLESGTEGPVKILLFLQTVLLLAILAYCWIYREYGVLIESFSMNLQLLGSFFILFFLLFLFKHFAYIIVGKTFFEKDALHQFLDNFISLICLLGIVIFLPTVTIFFVKEIYLICYFIIFFCVFIVAIVIIYKTYVLFFQNKGLLIYLFLYLCGLEILPLFFIYKGLYYLFNVVEKNTLWL